MVISFIPTIFPKTIMKMEYLENRDFLLVFIFLLFLIDKRTSAVHSSFEDLWRSSTVETSYQIHSILYFTRTMTVSVLLPKEILDSSPSKQVGVPEKVEQDYRIFGCQLIREAAIRLKLYFLHGSLLDHSDH